MAHPSPVITFLPSKSHLFTDQIEFLKIIAMSFSTILGGLSEEQGQCVGSLVMREPRNTSEPSRMSSVTV